MKTQTSPTLNGHTYVDLGLSVLWATSNIGASQPEEPGHYFAWGETMPKNEYTEANSETYNKVWRTGMLMARPSLLSRRNSGTIAGDVRHDAARALWGELWRLPSQQEIKELIEQCPSRWTMQNGMNGYLFSSNKTGQELFLPAAGCRDEATLHDVNKHGYYWSASPCRRSTTHALHLYLENGYRMLDNFMERYHGLSIRPVAAPQ